VIPLFVANALSGRPLVIFGENKILDFVWVGDVVDSLVRAVDAPVAGQTINIGSGEGTGIEDLARRVLQLTGSRSALEFAGARKAEIDRFVADIRLAGSLLNYRPSAPLAHLPEVVAACGR
jgi:UDP-glucose 4-epimerase